ncbi:MAG: fumarylacetoacetate hydrolase family protein [Anaerolineae bacterium]|nr:fumarylacetoacetate hydrolase family protein [Anaerolineae bacterium]
MTTPFLTRFYHPESGYRVGVRLEDALYDVTEHIPTVGAFLRNSVHHVAEAIEGLVVVAQETGISYAPALFDAPPVAFQPHWLPPCDEQDVWAAGVTYERSRAARQEEARDGGDIYARVYAAERPELFFKAHGSRVVGPAGQVGIRADSRWNVPEPELALVINPAMELVGFTVGNDMSSRDIEGENPLYLPQAKVYSRSCALGPGVMLAPSTDWPQTTIRLKIERGGQTAFEGDVHTARIRRRIGELLDYLGRSTEFPDGAILLTGTGVVPPNEFTLQAEDVVTITIGGVGTLRNPVVVV